MDHEVINETCKWTAVWSNARVIKSVKVLLILSIFMMVTLYGYSAAALDTRAQKSAYSEYAVKAAYLYNFAKFIDWPAEVLADTSLPLTICIYGKDPFGNSIDVINNKTVKGRGLQIKRYLKGEELAECHVIFISPSERKYLSSILEKVKDKHILTVSDIEDFAYQGGMINLINADRRIRLEINLDAARRSGLTVSSKLLKISKIIKGEGEKR